MTILGEAWITIRPETASFSREAQAQINGSLGGLSTGKSAMALGAIGAAFAVAGAESVKMASQFQASMAMIQTNAGASAESVKQLSSAVLGLAGKVGVGPESLSEALYHIESSFASTGISGQRAMDILKVSAEGARLGAANLVDVTNALDAAVVANIPGAENFEKAMGTLNATVGSGDMHMQDLADAFGRGTLVLAKGFGLSLRDVGAALAVFGDNLIRGSTAGTQLRMMLQSMVAPTMAGKTMLDELGLSGKKLAEDMAHGGLNEAIIDLKKHLDDAGITGAKVADWMTQAFGKKAGAGLETLVTQFDRLESKYVDIDKGANNFSKSWEATQQTFKQRWNEATAAMEALAIKIGLVLIPIVEQVVVAFTRATTYLLQHNDALKALGLVILPVVVAGLATLVGIAGTFVGGFIAAAAPIIGVGVALEGIALAADHAYTHMEGFRDNVNTLATDVASSWQKLTDKWNTLLGDFKKADNTSKNLADFMGPVASRQGANTKAPADFMGPTASRETTADFMGPTLARQQSETQKALSSMRSGWNSFIAYLRSVATSVGEAMRHIGNAIHDGLLAVGKVEQGFWHLMQAFWRTYGDDLMKTVRGIWDAIFGLIRGALLIVEHIIAAALDLINGNFQQSGEESKKVLTVTWGAIAEIFAGLWKSILGAFGVFATLLQQAFSGLIGTLKDLVWDPIVAVGKSIVDGIWSGITSAWDAMVGKFRGLLGSLAKDAAHAIDAHSPSRLFARTVGEPIPQGVAAGIDAAAYLPSESLKKMLNSMMVVGAVVPTSKGLMAGSPNPNAPGNAFNAISGTLVDSIKNHMGISGAVGLTQNGIQRLTSRGVADGITRLSVDVNVNAPHATHDTVAALRKVAQEEIAGSLHAIVRGATAGVGARI